MPHGERQRDDSKGEVEGKSWAKRKIKILLQDDTHDMGKRFTEN